MSTDAPVGTEVAGYRIERLLGRGGMSVVYLAEHLRLGRNVALKLLAPELAHDDRFRERFLRESKLAASIDHPNVIPIYDADEADGALYIAMRYVSGTDLRQLLAEEGKLEPRRALSIVGQVAAALDAAHARGLVHRDVKPGNILVAAEEHVYLSDFGLTKQASSHSGLTQTGQLVGTLDYVAPEQIEGREVDGRSDVYSLGWVLYECLAGAKPFARDTEVAVLWAHMHEVPPKTGDAAVDAVLTRAMAKSPGDRYATAGELAADARRASGISTGELTRPAPRRLLDRRLLALVVAVVLVVPPAVALLVRGGGSTGLASVPVNSVGVIDPKTNRIVASIPVGGVPSRVAAGPSGIWVADTSHGTVERLDPERASVATTIGLGVRTSDIAVDRDGVWATDTGEGTLLEVDPVREVVNQSVKVRANSIKVDTFVGAGFPKIVAAGGALSGPTALRRSSPVWLPVTCAPACGKSTPGSAHSPSARVRSGWWEKTRRRCSASTRAPSGNHRWPSPRRGPPRRSSAPWPSARAASG
jgi:YVTN family beta-propeller protein